MTYETIMAFDKKDNEVVMLEQSRTNDDYPEKPIPAIAKVDYSGAYEVRLHFMPYSKQLLTKPRKPTLERLHS